MILIGLLHQRKDPKTVRKAIHYARAAKAENAELLYFSPEDVDFEKQKINGLVLKDGKWRRVHHRFPDVIYNAGSPAKLAIYQDIIDRLKMDIPFTTHSVGHKMSVYKRLKKAGTFSEYLIPSIVIPSSKDLYPLMDQYSKLIFKPVDGHQGQGVTYIEKLPNSFLVKYNGQQFYYNDAQLQQFIANRLAEKQYLAQPYICSRTKNGIPFDLRLHVQKNGQGQWIMTLMYVRISRNQSIVTNLSSGGYRVPIEKFLSEQYPMNPDSRKHQLESFALHLAKHLDDLQIENHSQHLDELGIDIGIDEKNKLWIYEVNWRPGLPHALYGKTNYERTMIQYAKYLAQNKSNSSC